MPPIVLLVPRCSNKRQFEGPTLLPVEEHEIEQETFSAPRWEAVFTSPSRLHKGSNDLENEEINTSLI